MRRASTTTTIVIHRCLTVNSDLPALDSMLRIPTSSIGREMGSELFFRIKSSLASHYKSLLYDQEHIATEEHPIG